MAVATLLAAIDVVGLVLLGGMWLRRLRPAGWVVVILCWPVAGLLHLWFVSPAPWWGLPLYAILGVALLLVASGWRSVNPATWRGWLVPLFCWPLAAGGVGYAFGVAASPVRPDGQPRYYTAKATSSHGGPQTVVLDRDTGNLVGVGPLPDHLREYNEGHRNRAAWLGALFGLAAAVVICRFRVVPPSKADRIRKLFLDEFPAERPSLKPLAEQSEHVRRSLPNITREPTAPAPTDSATGSEA